MIIRSAQSTLLCLWSLLASTKVHAISFNMNNVTARDENLALLATGLMDYYTGDKYGGTPGMFSAPYYWWEAGAAWNSMLDYWYYTGDTSYNEIIKEALLFQVGQNWDYMPLNQTTTEGNDDQGFWGVTVMAAAEWNFSNPADNEPGWLYLAQAVFNTMAARWDAASCNGGLRWQIYMWNNGYNYKNSVSNGCMFHIGARLARFTGNDTYVEWAERIFDWLVGVSFINTTEDGWRIFDGALIAGNCTQITDLEWTYNYGLFLSGCAYLYNYTNDSIWLDRINHIWERATVFFMPGTQIMYEAACQPTDKCDNDERCFKGIFSRFLGLTMLMAPVMNETIYNYLAPSVPAVESSCSGGYDGHTCGLNWGAGKWDGMYGLGEQMSALELLLSRLIWTKPPPLRAATGGTSKGNSSAGSSRGQETATAAITVSGKDRAGAGVITALFVILFLASACWMSI